MCWQNKQTNYISIIGIVIPIFFSKPTYSLVVSCLQCCLFSLTQPECDKHPNVFVVS